MNKMKNCKVCQKEVAKNAKVCPHCGAKLKNTTANILAVVFIIICLFVVIGSCSNNSSTTNNSSKIKTEEITYNSIELNTLFEELESNALKAEKTYKDSYVEFTGKISNIDSDGSYISVSVINQELLDFNTIMCHIKNDEQLNVVLEKSVGDTVTIQGKITSIGEFLGYSLDIDTIK